MVDDVYVNVSWWSTHKDGVKPIWWQHDTDLVVNVDGLGINYNDFTGHESGFLGEEDDLHVRQFVFCVEG